MDKQNYIIKHIEAQDLEEDFDKIISFISGFVEKFKLLKRRRIIKDYRTLVIAAYTHIVLALSYQRLSDHMSIKYGVKMSDTAWKKQMKRFAPYFLDAAMEYLNQHSLPSHGKLLKHSQVCAIDTTEISVQGGKGAGIRAHTCLSLTCSGKVDVTVTDQHIAESVTNFKLRKGQLYIADRAYGKAKEIAFTYKSKADFLFRISPRHITLYSDKQCKHKIDFKVLAASGKPFSRLCYCKHENEIYRLRVVGEMLPSEKQEAAQKRAEQKSTKKQSKANETTLLFSKWLFLVTSLTKARRSELIRTYRRRWDIEIHFKKIKSLLKFHKIRRSLLPYMMTSVYLWLAVAFCILAVRCDLFPLFHFDYSEFNIFSLIEHLVG